AVDAVVELVCGRRRGRAVSSLKESSMNNDQRRITLVNSANRSFDWRLARDARSRIVFAASFAVLRYALADAVREFAQDIERVIIDRTATAADFLDILAHVSDQFAGDFL